MTAARPLRVLIVEDSEDDTQSVVLQLRRGGFDPTWTRVETAAAMRAALGAQAWDIVIADYALPAFKAPAALAVLKESGIDLPFIVVSGVITEEEAVELMKAGAHDYIRKRNLARLVPAVERELREAEMRREHQRAAEALREAEARTRAILDTAAEGIITIDEGGIIESFNPAAERLFAYTREEVLGRNVSLLMPWPFHEQHDGYLAHFLSTGEARVIGRGREVVGRRKDGTVFPIDLAVSQVVLGTRRLFTGIVRDVSERRRAERRLAAQYAVTAVLAGSTSLAEASVALLQAVGEGVGWELGELWRVDAACHLLRCEGVWNAPQLDAEQCAALGRGVTFALGRGLPGRVWATGQAVWITNVQSDLSFVRASGARRIGLRSAFAFPLRSESAVLGVMAFFSCDERQPDQDWLRMFEAIGCQIGDFMERKRAEAMTRDSEARFHAFMDNGPAVAFIKDEAGRYVYINAVHERLFGLPLSDVYGKTDFDLLPVEIARQVRANDQTVLARNATLELEERLPAPDGSVYDWLVFKFPFTDGEGRRFVGGMAVDITERRRAEAKAREYQELAQQRARLADIGAIAAEIVHDLGNPLAGVSMQAQLILRRARRDESQPVSIVVKPAEHIVSEVHRLTALIGEFMDFAREQRLDLKTIELPHFLQEVADLWRPVAAARAIDVALASGGVPTSIRADAEKLRRVLDNLVKNAVEAIGQGPGRVTLSASAPAAGKVRISVEDTGPGIPGTVRLFRLFETTKRDGTGLGLAVAKQIVEAHGGTIGHQAVEPHGTVFHIELPRAGWAA